MLLVALCLFIDLQSYSIPKEFGIGVTALHCAILLALALVDVRWAVAALLVSLVLADDISRVSPLGMTKPMNFMTVSIRGVAAVNYVSCTIIIIGILLPLFRYLRRPGRLRFLASDYCVLAIGGIYTLAALHGWPSLLAHPRAALNQANLPIMVCGLYLVVRLHVRTQGQMLTLWYALVWALAAKSLVGLGFAGLGIGAMFGQTLRVGHGMVMSLLTIPLTYGIILQLDDIPMKRHERMLALVCALAAGVIVLITAGRMTWLFSIYGLVLVGLLSRGTLTLRPRAILLSGACVTLILVALLRVTPSMFVTITGTTSTLDLRNPAGVLASNSIHARVYEFKNIAAELRADRNQILGQGLGSSFSDRYHPFPFEIGPSDYPDEQRRVRQFSEPHGLVQVLWLRLGYGGAAVFLSSVLGLYICAFSAFFKTRHPALLSTALALVAVLPGVVYMTWSAKGNMICGIALGITGTLHMLCGRKEGA